MLEGPGGFELPTVEVEARYSSAELGGFHSASIGPRRSENGKGNEVATTKYDSLSALIEAQAKNRRTRSGGTTSSWELCTGSVKDTEAKMPWLTSSSISSLAPWSRRALKRIRSAEIPSVRQMPAGEIRAGMRSHGHLNHSLDRRTPARMWGVRRRAVALRFAGRAAVSRHPAPLLDSRLGWWSRLRADRTTHVRREPAYPIRDPGPSAQTHTTPSFVWVPKPSFWTYRFRVRGVIRIS